MSGWDWLRRKVFHNWSLKITSLLLAAGLWLAVSSSPPAELALNAALIFRNMPSDLEISSESVPSVQIRVRGPEALVRRLQPSDIRVEIDLSGLKPGERTFDLTHQVKLPDRIELSEVVPGEVHVAFDLRAKRSVPVQPRVTGAIPGYEITWETNPATIEITGPRKEVEAVACATTDPVDLTGVLKQITVSRVAYVSDPLIQVVNARPVEVTVTMERSTSLPETHP
jgi:YbbR domain-containing protein